MTQFLYYVFPAGKGSYGKISRNVNEVIRAVLNSLFFFTKRFRTHKKHKNNKKNKNVQAKAQKRK